MNESQKLATVEEIHLYKVVCDCGWKSSKYPNSNIAVEKYLMHIIDKHPTIYKTAVKKAKKSIEIYSKMNIDCEKYLDWKSMNATLKNAWTLNAIAEMLDFHDDWCFDG